MAIIFLKCSFNLLIRMQNWEIQKKRSVMKCSILSNSLTPPNPMKNGNQSDIKISKQISPVTV